MQMAVGLVLRKRWWAMVPLLSFAGPYR